MAAAKDSDYYWSLGVAAEGVNAKGSVIAEAYVCLKMSPLKGLI